MAKSNVDINVSDKDNVAKLDNVRIKDREMIPEWNVITRKSTETIYEPIPDENGNIINKTIGIKSIVETSSVITLRPEEYYKYKEDNNAEGNGREIKEGS
jgi:hypothetical protein